MTGRKIKIRINPIWIVAYCIYMLPWEHVDRLSSVFSWSRLIVRCDPLGWRSEYVQLYFRGNGRGDADLISHLFTNFYPTAV